jgi:hypothetical protein
VGDVVTVADVAPDEAVTLRDSGGWAAPLEQIGARDAGQRLTALGDGHRFGVGTVDADQDLIAVRVAAKQREGVAEAALDQGLRLRWQGVGLWGRRCGHPLVPLSRVDYGWDGSVTTHDHTKSQSWPGFSWRQPTDHPLNLALDDSLG